MCGYKYLSKSPGPMITLTRWMIGKQINCTPRQQQENKKTTERQLISRKIKIFLQGRFQLKTPEQTNNYAD